MMSAKTVSTDVPATTTPSPAGGATPTAPGAEASPFQNLLAAASPQVVDLTLDTLQAQLPQFAVPANAKQPGRPVLVSAQPATGTQPGAQSPADLLQLLEDAALPESGDAVCSAPEDFTDDVGEELDDASRQDILSEWIDAMVPAGVFAPQAGSDQPGEAPEKRPGGQEAKGVAIPTSLVAQALVPDDTAAKAAAAANATISNAPPAPTNVAAIIAPPKERAERDSSASEWMNALGDATAKRTQDTAPATAARIPIPVHDSRWADAIAHRLVMMAREGESIAQLKLVPVDLGPLDIQITVKDSEASVHFGAANAETRSVLESSIPRLREMLSAQGLQLNNASVSHQSANQNKPERSSGPSAVNGIADDPDSTPAKVVSTSLLDIYA